MQFSVPCLSNKEKLVRCYRISDVNWVSDKDLYTTTYGRYRFTCLMI